MPNEIDSKKLRHVAGAFATGVTVVSLEKQDGSIIGMTANSFLSVSLSPPLVMFSVQKRGTMAPFLKEGITLGISILSDQQEEASDQFAGRNNPPIDVPMVQPTKGIHVIENCLAWYHTIVHNIVPVGDHMLIFCTVVDLDRSEDKNPLLYYSGYQRIAPSSEKVEREN